MSEKEEKTAPAVLHPEDRTLGMAFLRDTIEKYKAKLMEPGKTLGPMAVTWLLDGIVDRLCVLESMLHGDGEWRKQTRWPMVQEWLKKAEGAGVESETVTDCNGLGNAAQLREALESTEELLEHFAKPGSILADAFALHLRDNRAALAAPPRNCDRFATANEAVAAFGEHLEKCKVMAATSAEAVCDYFVDWLFAPATPEKGGEE